MVNGWSYRDSLTIDGDSIAAWGKKVCGSSPRLLIYLILWPAPTSGLLPRKLANNVKNVQKFIAMAMTNVKVLHLLLTSQSSKILHDGLLRLFYWNYLFFFKFNRLERLKLTTTKKNWEVGEGRISISTGRLRTIGVFVSHLVLTITTWMPRKYFCSLS